MNFSNNAKLLLESLLLVCYLLIGAFIFQALEKKNEQREKTRLKDEIASLQRKYNISNEGVISLMEIFERPYATKEIETWSFGNAFVFAGTIVTTVGEYNLKWIDTFYYYATLDQVIKYLSEVSELHYVSESL